MPGLQFTETMRGYFSPSVQDDYDDGFERGRDENSPFEFTLTISTNDLSEMLRGQEHEGRMEGSVHAPALSPHPLSVADGTFNLFVVDSDEPGTHRMRYRMTMTSQEGRDYYLDGFKRIHDDPGFDLWSDTTTLYITVHEGSDAEAPVLGTGKVTIRPDDFMKQLTTMEVTGAANHTEQLRSLSSFGRFFGGTLYDTYGGIFARPNIFDPEAAPRPMRPLRVGPPEVHFFNTSDGVQLRLTRYQGGSKGPVILSHGFGVSSRIFATDTIQTNLLEYLFEHGYDVWLLDYRVSIELPSSDEPSTADDVATKDYPAAVDYVRTKTGAESVQMVVHCYGSTTFFMAMLAGLEGVRSAVCSQIATHVKAPPLSRFKAGLHLPEVLDTLGVEMLTAYVDTHADWKQRLVDQALKLSPVEAEESCTSPVCRRITFLYGHLYEHDQLNKATHDTLHELFGVANLKTFEHLTLLVREGHLVSADGDEAYLPHLDRLALPITFIHGAENACFLPESTATTYDLLRQQHGADLYGRHVIPNYGHIDCILGKNAVRDVYPRVLDHLEETNP